MKNIFSPLGRTRLSLCSASPAGLLVISEPFHSERPSSEKFWEIFWILKSVCARNFFTVCIFGQISIPSPTPGELGFWDNLSWLWTFLMIFTEQKARRRREKLLRNDDFRGEIIKIESIFAKNPDLDFSLLWIFSLVSRPTGVLVEPIWNAEHKLNRVRPYRITENKWLFP